jgi:hypothetical protein
MCKAAKHTRNSQLGRECASQPECELCAVNCVFYCRIFCMCACEQHARHARAYARHYSVAVRGICPTLQPKNCGDCEQMAWAASSSYVLHSVAPPRVPTMFHGCRASCFARHSTAERAPSEALKGPCQARVADMSADK